MDSWDIVNKLNQEYDELYNECESFKKELKKSKYINCIRDIEFLYRNCLEIEIDWIQDQDYEDNKKSLQSLFLACIIHYKGDYDILGHIREPCLDKTIDELENEYETLKEALN
tara:strand:+ start:1080 stop:1418 length:339 start_codon:yes stop_codon:yes gene_type:complete